MALEELSLFVSSPLFVVWIVAKAQELQLVVRVCFHDPVAVKSFGDELLVCVFLAVAISLIVTVHSLEVEI